MPLRVGCRVDDADKHEFDVNFLLYHKEKLYSAGDDGKIKAWTTDLTKIAEVQAHTTSVYSLAADDNSLYSSSNDGSVKSFDLGTLKEKDILVKDDKLEFWKVTYANGSLYAGDNEGNIRIWKNGKSYGFLNIAEPVKDMVASGNVLFTAKDVDLIVSEANVEGEKLVYGTINTFTGRAPLALIGNQLLALTSREGKDILIHENNADSHYKLASKLDGAHEMLINSLAGTIWSNQPVLFSGGWDKIVKKWNVENNALKPAGSLDVEIVINSIAIGDKGEIYVGGGDGHIVRIEIE